MDNFVQTLFLSIYAVMKDIVTCGSPQPRKKPLELFSNYLGLLLAIVFVIGSILALLPCFIFRSFLYVPLRIFHGKSFGGFLTGPDALHEINSDPVTINVVMMYRTDKTAEGRLVMMKSCAQAVHDGVCKFTSSVGNLFGYLYFIKDQVKPEDVIVIADGDGDGYMSKNDLYDYLEENCKTIKENQMWKISMFTRPIGLNEHGDNDSSALYAFILSIRHSLGDGPSLVGILKKFMIEVMDKDKVETWKIKLDPNDRPKMKLKNVYVHRNPLTKRLERGALKIKNNRNWHLATYVEAEPKYIPLIKNLKQKLNVSFVDVVSAAVNTSVLDYINQRNVKIKTVTGASIVRVRTKDLPEIIRGTYDFKTVSNNFGVVAYNIPFNSTELNMRRKILSMQGVSDSLKDAVDFFLMYGLLQGICSYVPIWVTRFFCRRFMEGATVVITNLVGISKSTCGGCQIEDIFVCVPDCLKIGFLFCIFSYDDRLSITITSAKGYVHSREELQTILSRTLHYLDLAEEEIMFENTPI